MNEIWNKFLLAGDKFMPEMHLRQQYSPCWRNKERLQNLKNNTRFSIYFYQNELDKHCFQHDMSHGDF